MPLVVRRYQDTDRPGLSRVRSMVYRAGGAVGPEEKLLRDDTLGFVAELNGEIVGSAAALKMTASKGEEVIKCAGIASVGVLPNLRRGGVGSELMRGVNQLLREDGFALASLYPYRETYYRRFGYEVCGGRLQITCPTHRLPKFETALEVRPFAVDQYQQLQPVMRAMGTRYAGFNVGRTADQWWRGTGGDTSMAIFVAGDPIEAFAIIRLRDDFWETVEVRELAWKTRAGYESMLALFGRIAINHNAIQWCEPSDSPLLYKYLDQAVQIESYRPIMFRVLDVGKCLRSIATLEDGAIQIDDPDIPENSGVWEVSTASKVDREPHIRLSIQEFTQAFLGEPSLRSIARQSDQGLLASIEAVFPGQPTYCSDYF